MQVVRQLERVAFDGGGGPGGHGVHIGVGAGDQHNVGGVDLPLLHPFGHIDQDLFTSFEVAGFGQAVSAELVVIALEVWVVERCCA